jgi:hypothetical protein
MKQYRSYSLKSLFSNTIICISISLFSCNSPKIRVSGNDFNQRDIDTVSIVSVLDNPGSYHQKKLAIEGVSSFGFEMSGIFIDEASRRNLTFENAVWLIPAPTISNAQIDSIEKFFNNKLLRVIGRFDSSSHGHLGFYKGTLEVIYFEQL